jgi:hypothetical protein
VVVARARDGSRQAIDLARRRQYGESMATFDIEQVDLAALVAMMRSRFESPPAGAVVGRTQMRDAIAEHLGCSLLQAEQLVDTMIARGLVRLERDGGGREFWRLS